MQTVFTTKRGPLSSFEKKNEKRELKQSLYYLVAASSSLSRLSCEKTLHANHGVCVRACVRACVRVCVKHEVTREKPSAF